MSDTLAVTVTEPKEDENLQKFQKLLAYFVWHLEYMNGEAKGKQIFCDDGQKEIQKGYQTGQGYNGDGIQENIKEWELLKNGRVCISVRSVQKGDKYFSKSSYLNWAGFAGNVSIYVQYKDGHITSLYIKDKWNLGKEDKPLKYRNIEAKYSLADLGISVSVAGAEVKNEKLHEDADVKTNLKNFYEAFVEAKRLETALRLSIAKNIIFTGAPGTGKTYLAKEIADLIKAKTEFVQFHPSYDYTDFVEGLRPVKDSNNPNQIVFERKDGIFKTFCERALIHWLTEKLPNQNIEQTLQTALNKVQSRTQEELSENQKKAIDTLKGINLQKEEKFKGDSSTEGQANTPKPFVFIVDELNRGEISKIFGELFFSVDPGYRGIEGAVKTQYANLQTTPNLFDLLLIALGKANEGDYGHFFIPENVYIIGTMNDIDRSVESMDFAFRRRFTFIEITAKETQLQILNSMEKVGAKTIDALVEKMDELNKAIYDPDNKSTDNQYDLSEAYHIGAAYFKHYEDYVGQDKPEDKLWNNHLEGVLYEYLRGKPNAEDILKKWRNAYANGLLSIVDLDEDKLIEKLEEKGVTDADNIINSIRLFIRENIELTKKALKDKLQKEDSIKSAQESIKQCWEEKKKATNKKTEQSTTNENPEE